MVLTPWADEIEIELAVKEQSKAESLALNEEGSNNMEEGAVGSAGLEQLTGAAKTLCIPFEDSGHQPALEPGQKCFFSGKPAKNCKCLPFNNPDAPFLTHRFMFSLYLFAGVLWGRSY
jgi:prolyl-tRNA synthetase